VQYLRGMLGDYYYHKSTLCGKGTFGSKGFVFSVLNWKGSMHSGTEFSFFLVKNLGVFRIKDFSAL